MTMIKEMPMKLSNSQIMEDYSAKRALAQDAAKERRDGVYTLLPELKQIDDEISSISIMVSRKVLTSDEDQDNTRLMAELTGTVEALKARKKRLLADSGYPEDYLQVKYQCPHCNDTGFLKDKSQCSCYKRQLTEMLYDMSNISRIMTVENLKTFDISLFSDEVDDEHGTSPKDNMQSILEISIKYINGFDKRNDSNSCENLLFYGSSGLGKTFMCNSIAKEILDKGHSVVYQTSFKIIDILEKIRFRSDKDSDNSSEKMQLSILNSSDLLIIDDLGSEMVNSFTNAELFNIINSRILNGKSVIISTNLTPSELMDKYPGRISSRLFGSFKIIKFFGKDLRWTKNA